MTDYTKLKRESARPSTPRGTVCIEHQSHDHTVPRDRMHTDVYMRQAAAYTPHASHQVMADERRLVLKRKAEVLFSQIRPLQAVAQLSLEELVRLLVPRRLLG